MVKVFRTDENIILHIWQQNCQMFSSLYNTQKPIVCLHHQNHKNVKQILEIPFGLHDLFYAQKYIQFKVN